MKFVLLVRKYCSGFQLCIVCVRTINRDDIKVFGNCHRFFISMELSLESARISVPFNSAGFQVNFPQSVPFLTSQICEIPPWVGLFAGGRSCVSASACRCCSCGGWTRYSSFFILVLCVAMQGIPTTSNVVVSLPAFHFTAVLLL